jgi:Fe2+ or Zn2+ uptake regulation protein
MENEITGDEEVLVTLVELGRERLTKKQKKILKFLIAERTKASVTRLVPIMSEKLECSQSAVWNNLLSLKKSHLVDFGSMENRGRPVRLTESGLILARNLMGDKEG